jgi:hypothetical protein
MQVEFYQDDNGKLWLYYARKIILREPKVSPNETFMKTPIK